MLLPALPILLPLLAGATALMLLGRPRIQRALGVAASGGLFTVNTAIFWTVLDTGSIVLHVGSWPAPYGITLVADVLSAGMLFLTGIMALAVNVYSLQAIDGQRAGAGYFALMQFMLMGVCGALLTGDLFNLFVWFEVTLLASFVLLVMGGERPQLEGAMKYVTMNLIASVLLLSAIGILYGKMGTLNMADLAFKVRGIGAPGLMLGLALLFLTSFGIKSALFPLFFWLPAAYHTAPIAVTALFSGLLTKMGIYAMFRVFPLVFPVQFEDMRFLLLVIAGCTMTTGVLGAVVQYDMRRLLSFHIVSQIGYLLMGLALFTPLGLASALFFMAHVILAKSVLFLVGGTCYRIRGTYDLRALGALYAARPGVSALFLIGALSLAGIPPLSGFFAKFGLVRAAIEAEAYGITATALAVSILTLYSMTKIWSEAFWKPAPGLNPESLAERDREAGRFALLQGPAVALCLLIVVMGLAAEPVFGVCMRAAEQILNPDVYIVSVLGELP